ncbi:MAG: DJ-1/PfpI family protein [Bacillota bacterium]|nr:DJ-1/PfpI family protein [Bacillota bacterium]
MKEILLLLPKGAELWEAAAFTDVFGWNQVCGDKSCRLRIAGPAKEVALSFGHRMQAELLWDAVVAEDYAALAIPGGFPRYGYFRCCGRRPLELIRSFHQAQKPIAAVCTASLLLGKAGILQGRRAATYCSGDTDFRQQLAACGAKVSGESLVEDGNLISGAGPGSAAQVALALLARCSSPENAAKIKNLMLFEK